MKNKKNNKKRKLNKRKVINALMILVFLVSTIYYVSNLHVKRIIIEGNTLVKDYEIIEKAGLKDYPLIFELSKKSLEENIINIELVNSVKIKRNILGYIKIIIEEDKPLCYISKNTLITSNNKKISNIITYGLPTLITEVDDETLNVLTNILKKINKNELKLISEISYSPSISSKGEVIDSQRFILYMNDENQAIVNLLNIEKFNNYLNVVNATVTKFGSPVKGTYHFELATSKVTFESYDSQKVIEEELNDEQL